MNGRRRANRLHLPIPADAPERVTVAELERRARTELDAARAEALQRVNALFDHLAEQQSAQFSLMAADMQREQHGGAVRH